jgi:hypothetical protein
MTDMIEEDHHKIVLVIHHQIELMTIDHHHLQDLNFDRHNNNNNTEVGIHRVVDSMKDQNRRTNAKDLLNRRH